MSKSLYFWTNIVNVCLYIWYLGLPLRPVNCVYQYIYINMVSWFITCCGWNLVGSVGVVVSLFVHAHVCICVCFLFLFPLLPSNNTVLMEIGKWADVHKWNEREHFFKGLLEGRVSASIQCYARIHVLWQTQCRWHHGHGNFVTSASSIGGSIWCCSPASGMLQNSFRMPIRGIL